MIELGGQDAKIIIFKENEKTGDKTAHDLDERQVRLGHRRHHRQVLPQGRHAAARTSPTLRFDDSKLHHVAAKCGVFAETDIVNLVKSGIPSNEIMCSLADAIVMQNLSVLTRGNTLQAQGAAARRAQHVPAVPAGVLAQAHPRDLGRARLRLPQGRPDRGADLRARERRSTTPRSARCMYGLHEPADGRRATRASTALDDFITHGPQGASSARRAGPPLVARPERARRVPRAVQDPEVRATPTLEPGKTSAA